MEGEELSSTMLSSSADQSTMQEKKDEIHEEEVILPDELVERILAMVPFPTVFKFRVLSRSWRARLSSVSPEEGDDDATKCLALSFRNQIRHRSCKWKSFCPFSLSANRQDFVAFDRTSNTWLRIPSFLQLKGPMGLSVPRFSRHTYGRPPPASHGLRLEGALLLLPTVRGELFVANILTRSWKQLPPRPHGTGLGRTHLSQTTAGTYKVIVMPHQRDHHNFLQIYDSASAAWSSLKLASSWRSSPLVFPSDNSNLEPVAYLDGVLYLVTIPITLARQHLAHHKILSIKTQEELEVEETSAQDFNVLGELGMPGKWLHRVNPAICEPNLLIIFLYLRSKARKEDIQAVHIDLETGQLLRVALCPVPCPPRIIAAPDMNPVIDCEDDIIVCADLSLGQLLTYNVQEDKWAWVHYSGLKDELAKRYSKYFRESIRSSFRPGLNPFAEV